MSHLPALPQHKKGEATERYELEAHQSTRYSRPSVSQPEVGYAEPRPQCQALAQTSVEHNGAPTAVIDKAKRNKVLLITLTTTLLLCLLVVSLVAVILYSPQVRTSSESAADLLSRIEQLERELTTLKETQGTNSTLATLTSLQESQESMEASISRLSTSVNSQINSIQSLSLQNLREDLDRLRSVDLYRGCTQETRSCTMSTGGSTSYYWRSCTASSIYINPTVSYLCVWFKLTFLNCAQYSSQDTQYYTVDIRCDYSTNYGYIESSTLYKNVNNYYSCYCDVTRLSGSTHSTLTSSFTATCTLTVTRCPRSVNLLN